MPTSDISTVFDNITSSIADSISAFIPNLFMGILVFTLGWLIALAVKNIVLKAGHLIEKVLPDDFFWRSSNTRSSMRLTQIVSTLAYWLILFAFTISAIGNLGISSLNNWLEMLISYLPNILSACVVLFLGYIFSQIMVKNIAPLLHHMDKEQSDNLLRLFHLVIIVVTVVLAINQVGIDTQLLTNLITLVFAAFLGGLALAIGLGAGPFFTNMLSSRQIHHSIKPGDHITIDEISGQVLSIEPTEVLIATQNGRVRIPARRFNEVATTISGDPHDH